MAITADTLFSHYDREANKALRLAQDLRVRGNPVSAANAAEEAARFLRVSDLATKLTEEDLKQVSAAREQIRRNHKLTGSKSLLRFIRAEFEVQGKPRERRG